MSLDRFNGKSFYDLVKEFYNGNFPFLSADSEIDHAFRRTCISRIYYSILLQIGSKYDENPSGIKDSHNFLISKVPRESRNNLHDMKDFRIKADYNISSVVDVDDVQDQFDLYENTISRI